MKKRKSLAVALAACLLAVGSARAQERSGSADILQAIPGDAIGFVVVNDLERVSGKIAKVGGKLKLPVLLPPLQLLKLTANIQKGLDEKGAVALVVLPTDGEPNAILMVPVTNYKDFIGNFNAKDAGDKISELTVVAKTLYAGKKGGYAVLAAEDGGGKDAVKKVIGSATGVAGSVKGVEKWLTHNDVTAVLTPSGLKLTIGKMREGIDNGKNLLQNLPPEAQSIVKLLDGLDEFLKSSETEIRHIVAGGRIDASVNLEFAAQAVFAKKGKFAEGGAKVMPPAGGPLAGLPGGPFVIAAGGAFPDCAAGLGSFSLDMLKLIAKDAGEAPFKKLEEAYTRTYKSLRSMAVEVRVGKTGRPLLNDIVYAFSVTDAPAYMAAAEQAVRAMNDLFKDANIPFYKPVEIKKVKVGDLHALETTTDLSDNPGFALIPAPVMELIFGKEAKIMASVAAAGNDRILTQYAPASKLKKLIDSAKTNLSDDPGVMKTAALLPKGHQWAFYLSPKGTADAVKQAKAAFEEKSDMPAFPDTPPVGIGIKVSAAGLEGRLVVPTAVVEAVGILIPHIMKKFQGGGDN